MGKGDIKAIPKTDENYISFSKMIYVNKQQKPVELRFLDSYRMMPSSFDTLAENLYAANLVEIFGKYRLDKIIWKKEENEEIIETIEDENDKVTINTKIN